MTEEFINKIKLTSPDVLINEEEFENNLIKFGSFLSILKNKKINQTSLLSILLDDKDICKLFMDVVEYDDFNDVFLKLLDLYPNLARSKIIRIKYKKYLKDLQNARERTSDI